MNWASVEVEDHVLVRKQAHVVRDLANVPIKSNQDGPQVIEKEVVVEE
jgi:hypothetical protein